MGKQVFLPVRNKDNAGILQISSSSSIGKVNDECDIDIYGDDIEIGFNSKYITDVLKVIDDNEIVLEMVSGVKPCIIKPVSGERYEYLVLPVKIS